MHEPTGRTDLILREGAARELGRLTRGADALRVVNRLCALLHDSTPAVRRGAAEGLGLIGSQDSVTALKQALRTESDDLTKKRIEEALAICGGLALLEDPMAAKMTESDAADLFLTTFKTDGRGSTCRLDWLAEMLAGRNDLRVAEMLNVLAPKASSPNEKVSRAAASLVVSFKRAGSKLH